MSSRTSAANEHLPLLATPAEGVPGVVDTPAGLREAAAALANGSGPVAVDAERASGIRYDHRAFLVQLRRAGAGTVLIDPETLPDLSEVEEALTGVEWVLHAATQDIPCLREKNLEPDALFDTEIAARMLGWERFGLAAVVARTLGVRLAKEHSNVDWSKRPLPADWLNYAALDVEVLLEVRQVLHEELERSGKLAYAKAEFAHTALFTPRTYREPWRRTHGLGAVKSRRALARVRNMWTARDAIGAAGDVAPSSVLRDRVMVAIAQQRVRSSDELMAQPGAGALPRASAARLYRAIKDADAMPASELPPLRASEGGERPAVGRQEVKDRLAVLKPAVSKLAAEQQIAHDLLLGPALVKSLAGRERIGETEEVADYLTSRGARTWQVELTAPVLAAAGASLGED